MKIELTDLEEDILTVAKKNPDMDNEEIAEKLDCSGSWVGETRRKYESKIPDDEIPDELNGNYSGGGGGALATLILGPIKLSIWLMVAGLKASLWLMVLPFRILGAIFGSGSD